MGRNRTRRKQLAKEQDRESVVTAAPRAPRRQWLPYVFLAVLIALFFKPILLNTGHFFDDYVAHQYPKQLFYAKRLMAFKSPLFCSFADGGRPIGSDYLHSPLYPGYLLTLPPCSSYPVLFDRVLSSLYVAHIWWAAAGMVWLLRLWKTSDPAAMAGALTYALCAPMILRIQGSNPSMGMSWLPWIIGTIELLRRECGVLTWRYVRHAILAGAALGMACLSGHLHWFMWLCCFIGIWAGAALIGLWRTQGWRTARRFTLGLAITAMVGLSLGAVLFVPVLVYTWGSDRFISEAYKDTQQQVSWWCALTNIIPHLFGRVEGFQSGPYWNVFWGGSSAVISDYWERVSYSGIAAVVALACTPWWIKKTRSALGLGLGLGVLCCVIYMYGIESPIQYVLVKFVPILRTLHHPVRIAYFLAFPLACLVAFVIDWLWAEPQRTMRFRAVFAMAAALCVIIGLVAVAGLSCAQGDPLYVQLAWRSIWTQAALAGGLFTAFLVARISSSFAAAGKWLVVALVFADLYLFGASFLTGTMSAVSFNEPNEIVAMLKNTDKSFPVAARFRFQWDSIQSSLRPVYWELDSVNGYCIHNPPHIAAMFANRARNEERFLDLMNVAYNITTVSNEVQVQYRSTKMPRAWFVSRATVLDDTTALDRVYDPSFDPASEVVLYAGHTPQTAALTNVTQGGGTAFLTAYDHTRMTVRVTNAVAGFVVFSELFFSGLGWHAYVDEQPASYYRANVMFRAVPVPSGVHTVTFRYQPPQYYIGLWFYLVALAIVIAAVCIKPRTAGADPA